MQGGDDALSFSFSSFSVFVVKYPFFFSFFGCVPVRVIHQRVVFKTLLFKKTLF